MDRVKTLPTKFHPLPFLKIPAKSEAAYKLKGDKAFHITEPFYQF
jgi:hypothetical protein